MMGSAYADFPPQLVACDGCVVTHRNLPEVPAERRVLDHLGRKEGTALGESPAKTPARENLINTDLLHIARLAL